MMEAAASRTTPPFTIGSWLTAVLQAKESSMNDDDSTHNSLTVAFFRGTRVLDDEVPRYHPYATQSESEFDSLIHTSLLFATQIKRVSRSFIVELVTFLT